MNKPSQLDEFCPNCGDFVVLLNGESGFCFDCDPTPQTPRSPKEKWFTKYGDKVELMMQDQDVPARVAIAMVLSLHKAICIICNKPIKHGTYGKHFICSANIECRRARRRYKYLIYDKGYSKADALKEVTPPLTN